MDFDLTHLLSGLCLSFYLFQAIKILRPIPHVFSSMKCLPIHKSEQISPSCTDTEFLEGNQTDSFHDAALHTHLSSLLIEGLGCGDGISLNFARFLVYTVLGAQCKSVKFN